MREHDKVYARFVLEADKGWSTFAGQVLMIGIKNDVPEEIILEYIFETYHGMDLETEVPNTLQGIEKDLMLFNKMYHKGKRLQEAIGQENYDLMFDVVQDYVESNRSKDAVNEPTKKFLEKVEKLQREYF